MNPRFTRARCDLAGTAFAPLPSIAAMGGLSSRWSAPNRTDERLLEILQAVGQAFQPDVFLKNQKTVRLESLTYVETKDKR